MFLLRLMPGSPIPLLEHLQREHQQNENERINTERREQQSAELERIAREAPQRIERERMERQYQLIQDIMSACEGNRLDNIPQYLRGLDDHMFTVLSESTLRGNEEALTRMCDLLIVEENRRNRGNSQ